jgi:CRISPR-associated protein Csb2
MIYSAIVGRREANEGDKAARVRITPLPSIGHQRADCAIRRVLVEIPPNCPLRADDVEWTFSGLPIVSDQGEILYELATATDRGMLVHYGIEDAAPARLWRSVTPAALPERAARRRIDPLRLRRELALARGAAVAQIKETKSGGERLAEESRAAAAAMQAQRHANIAVTPAAIRVQREPFQGQGARVEDFAPRTRFDKERLWHIEIAFTEPLCGPLVIGDGRYLGLGLMAPQRDALYETVVFAVPAEAGVAASDGPVLAHAARRALMALARETLGEVPRLFSGHEHDGRRAASGRHKHIFLAGDDNDRDGRIDRLIIASPWVCDHRLKPDSVERQMFDEVVSKLKTLRAGRLGVITLGRPIPFAEPDALAGPARVWQSRTPYLATRHAGRYKEATAALIRDVAEECRGRGLPMPTRVEILEFDGVPDGGGLRAQVRLCFATAIKGPLLLGRDSHRGGGVFSVC